MVLIKIPQSTPFDPQDDDLCGVMSESEPDDDIDDPDWEEVKAKDEDGDDEDELEFRKMPVLPSGGVDIYIEDKRSKKDKKKKLDINEMVRKHVNRQKIELQLNRHKISLLFFVARGLRLLKVIRCDIIRGLALSLVDEWLIKQPQPQHHSTGKNTHTKKKETPATKRRISTRGAAKKDLSMMQLATVQEGDSIHVEEEAPGSKNDREFIVAFLEWFSARVSIYDDDDEERSKHLQNAFMINLLSCFKEHSVTSLIELVVIFAACLRAARPNLPIRILNILRPVTMRTDITPKNSNAQIISDSIFEERLISGSRQSNRKVCEAPPIDIDYLIMSNTEMASDASKKKKEKSSSIEEIAGVKVKPALKRVSRAAKSKNISYQEKSLDEDEDEQKSNPRKRSRKSEPNTNSKKNKKTMSGDDEYEETIKTKKQDGKMKTKKDKSQVSIHDNVLEKLDFWIEIYLENEKKWICVDVCNNKIDEPEVLNELSKPFYYLLSFDIDRYCIKPAEQFYCPDWYGPSFKRERCDPKWWQLVLDSYGPSVRDERDFADEVKSHQLLSSQDLPKSDSAFRNHPLYVLQKHLLKFQVIYPPDIVPVGYFKDEPIYPRDSVHTCRSRETWLRQARTVKLREEPYKIVKARPKRDRYSGEIKKDLPLEIFGEWQTEPYEPPIATGGKVPRNIYGNVDMYQPCMLPRGCVHLKLPGLQRIANKLSIDCAAAVIGFDNHCGSYGSHPVTEGFIVCEEYRDTLEAAWEEEQVNAQKRELEKCQKRIWDNWKRLLKAAIIREKLRVKYKD